MQFWLKILVVIIAYVVLFKVVPAYYAPIEKFDSQESVSTQVDNTELKITPEQDIMNTYTEKEGQGVTLAELNITKKNIEGYSEGDYQVQPPANHLTGRVNTNDATTANYAEQLPSDNVHIKGHAHIKSDGVPAHGSYGDTDAYSVQLKKEKTYNVKLNTPVPAGYYASFYIIQNGKSTPLLAQKLSGEEGEISFKPTQTASYVIGLTFGSNFSKDKRVFPPQIFPYDINLSSCRN